jgi:hypothetical protein
MGHQTSTKVVGSATDMTMGQRLLLETLAGHFAWLASAHPQKARTATVRKARQSVIAKLRSCDTPVRLAA